MYFEVILLLLGGWVSFEEFFLLRSLGTLRIFHDDVVKVKDDVLQIFNKDIFLVVLMCSRSA